MTPGCAAELTARTADGGEALTRGALGVCNVVRSLLSPTQTLFLALAIATGLAASLLGWGVYRRMPSRRMRNQCIAGALLGVQAIVAALLLFRFRSGNVFIFAKNFLNFDYLSDTFSGFLRGAKNTMQLATVGEVGGIVLGLLLAVLVTRAPRRESSGASLHQLLPRDAVARPTVLLPVPLPLGIPTLARHLHDRHHRLHSEHCGICVRGLQSRYRVDRARTDGGCS